MDSRVRVINGQRRKNWHPAASNGAALLHWRLEITKDGKRRERAAKREKKTGNRIRIPAELEDTSNPQSDQYKEMRRKSNVEWQIRDLQEMGYW